MLSIQKISKEDLNLLLLLADNLVLLNEQIAQLNGIGKRAVQKRINKLNQKGFIHIRTRNYKMGKGRAEFISSLSVKGTNLLKNENLIDNNILLERFLFNKIYNFEHELLVNWFRIYLNLLPIKITDLGVDFISATIPFLPLKSNGLPLISESFKQDDLPINFTPDGVFSIINKEKNKSLLFFLEVDMGTESLNSSSSNSNNIATKIKNYRAYFKSQKYKRYEKRWDTKFKGFRLLFLTNSVKRKTNISNFVSADNSSDFIWIANQYDLFEKGLGGKIWARGGSASRSHESILGTTLAFDLRLPVLK
jgi:biotin operon repressor